MDEQDLSQEQAQQLWNEEAAKLDAGDNAPALEAEAAAPESPPQEEPQQAAPEQPEQDVDPLAGLPDIVRAKLAEIDELKNANAQLLHHVKTAEGRVAAIQREIQLAKTAQQAVAPQDAPTQSQMAAAAKNPEEWEELKQDFPQWASAMEKYVSAQLGRVQVAPGLDPQAVAAFVQQQNEQLKAEMTKALEEARIEGKYEDWRDTVNTVDFAQWFIAQPADVRSLAESPRARDAIRMLDMFHATKSRSAQDIKQERGARLAAAAQTRPGQTPPPKTLDDLSPQEMWNHMAAQRERERAQRGY